MKLVKNCIPKEVMRRYSVVSERTLRGKDSGETALLKDDKVVAWFKTKGEAVKRAKELAYAEVYGSRP